jgi:DoxX-like family
VLEVAGAIGLLVGFVQPVIGALAGAGLLLLLGGAVVTHLRKATDHGSSLPPSPAHSSSRPTSPSTWERQGDVSPHAVTMAPHGSASWRSGDLAAYP